MRLTTAAIPVFLNAHVLKKSTLAALFLAAEMTGADAQTSGASRERPRASLACQSVTPQTCEIANSLGRGINLGNMLEAPVEGQWGVKLEPAYIDIVAGAFTTVRLPVRWSNNAAPTADATLDEAFAKTRGPGCRRAAGEAWNELARQTLAVVRASNPTRAVLIGPGEWNNIHELPQLRLPPDRNLIVSIHNYDPFPFTHQ